jgi:membrane protein
VRIVRKLLRVVPEAVQRFYADRCPQQAAGIAYRVLFSIAPLAIVLVSIFGLVLQDEELRKDVVKTIVNALPVSASGSKEVEKAITAIASPASAAGLLSLLLFAWAATGMMTSIRQGLETAMHVTRSRPSARGKLVDVSLVVGAAALVLVTAGLTVLGGIVQKTSGDLGSAIGLGGGLLADLVMRGTILAVCVAVVLLLYRFVPARGIRFREGFVGALVTAVLFQLIALASAFVYDKASNLSVVYGSLTAAFVFLYSVYLYSFVLLLGAEVAAAWAGPEPTVPGPPLLVQVKDGVRGLFLAPKDPPPPPPSPPLG